MKRLLHTSSTLLLIVTILFANPYIVQADEGDAGHQLEMEVNGYHVTLTSENDWAKGENTIVVTLADDMGMPLRNADVEILIAPKTDGHTEAKAESHSAEPQHDSMPGMEMDMDAPAEEMPAHDEEVVDPIAMREADEQGMYMVETHLELSGKHEVQVMFHVNGEMIQANFAVEIIEVISKSIVLWGFVMLNAGLIGTAAFLKKQPQSVKVGK
jgi:hypothetical protein